jgi:hypothetical protein
MRTGDDPAAGRFLINGERLIRVPFKLLWTAERQQRESG